MKTVAVIVFLISCPWSLAERAVKELWERPVIIGASLADGFTKADIFGPGSDELSLDRFLDEAVTADHGKFENKGTIMVFMAPKKSIQPQIDYIKAHQPSVVFGPDFLFWFLYGRIETEAKRLELLEEGLKLLEVVNCPLVVGDIPDARHAGGGILNKDQLPEVETIEKANRRIREWVKTKKNRAVIPVSDFMRQVRANEEITIRKTKVPKGASLALLQGDQLHPTARGAAMIALAALDALQKLTQFPATEVSWQAPED